MAYDLAKLHVAVCIPAYNSIDTIARAVNSALDQSHSRTTVVVVDDGSSDGTDELIGQISKENDRVFALLSSQNRGPAFARQKAINYSMKIGSDYICFLDADDFWFPNKVKSQLQEMVQNDFDLSFHQYEVHRNSRVETSFPGHPSLISLSYFERHRQFGYCLTAMVSRQAISKVNFERYSSFEIAEDFWYFHDLVERSTSVGFLPKVLARYEVKSGSRSSNRIRTVTLLLRSYVKRLGIRKGLISWSYYILNSILGK